MTADEIMQMSRADVLEALADHGTTFDDDVLPDLTLEWLRNAAVKVITTNF